MKKTFRFLSMAALALVGAVMTGCSSDDNIIDNPQQPASKSNVVTLTTTVGLDGGATTRALTSGGVKTFAAGETMALVYKKTGGATAVAVSDALKDDGDIASGAKSATFTFTLEDPDNSKNVTYVYPAAMAKADGSINYDALDAQDGTLGTLESSLDLATYTDSWNGTALPNVTLDNQLAILAITVKNSGGTDKTSTITSLSVGDGSNVYSVTRDAIAGPIYVAIKPTTSATIGVNASDGTTRYYKELTTAKTYEANNGYSVSWKMNEGGAHLSALTGNFTANNGDVLKGILSGNYQISIADGATVTLDGVTINGVNNGDNYQWAGINCIGDATIILSGTNTVKGFQENYPGVYVPSGNTLTINGTGSLTASSNGKGCGIGGGFDIACGNIVIAGGNITANGGMEAAGIGGGSMAGCGTISITGGTVTATGGEMGAGIGGGGDCSCGNITITGGTVNANGGWGAAGIGGGQGGSCGTVTITNGVTSVTATMCPGANYSIGCGIANDCGTVTIGCTLDGDGNPVGGTTGQISTSPYTYQPSN